jgi:hypothetical protein
MAEENLDSELEARAEVLEVRMELMLYRMEGAHLQLLQLRQRIFNLEILFEEFQEQCSLVSGFEAQQKESLRTTAALTEEPHGSAEGQDRPSCAIAEHDYQEMDKGTMFEIAKQVKQMAKRLEGKLEAVEKSGDSLQVAETETSYLDDSSTLSAISDKAEHTIEDSGQVKANKEEERPIEAKDVGTEQFGNIIFVTVPKVEQLEETQEIKLIKAWESIDERNVDEKLEAKETVKLEDDEAVSDNFKRKSDECQIPVTEIAANKPKDVKHSEKKAEMAMPIEMEEGTGRNKRGRRRSSRAKKPRNVTVGKMVRSDQRVESTGSGEVREDLESAISEELVRGASERRRREEEEKQSKPEEREGTEQDYEFERLELEWRLDQSDFDSREELDRRFSEEARKQEEAIQREITNSLELIILNIEKRMHAKLPKDVKRSLEERLWKVVEFSLMEMKLNMQSLGSRLTKSNDLNCWLQGELSRLYAELARKIKKEEWYRVEISFLQEKLNCRLIILEAADDYCRQLLGKYDEVTLNIELEMKKHRSLCEDYRNLRSEYEKLKAKCESTADSEGACGVAGQADAGVVRGREEARCAPDVVEKQMSVLAESQKELKRKVKSFREAPSTTENLSAERVEDYEALDKLRKVLMGVLENQPRENQPHSQCEVIEGLLTKALKERVSTVSHPYLWTGPRQGLGPKSLFSFLK